MNEKRNSDSDDGRKKMDWFAKSTIESSVRRIDELVTVVWASKGSGSRLAEPVLIELFVLSSDLVMKAKHYAQPVVFDDDVIKSDDPPKAKVQNVSDLLRFFRNAVCHPGSDKERLTEGVTISCNVVYGKGILIKIGDVELGSDYDDEVCFLTGGQRLYLRRHIVRACSEAWALLKPKVEKVR